MAYVVCKICRGTYPDDSDLIHEVWRRKDKDPSSHGTEFVGYFCDACLPGSVEFDPNKMKEMVPRYSNK